MLAEIVCTLPHGKRGKVVSLTATDVVRFQNKFSSSSGESSCWIWKASHNEGGYGVLSCGPANDRVYVSAHRIAYQLEYGDIDPTKVIDHMCRTTLCVNPHHLHQVTHKMNCENLDRVARVNNSSGFRGVSFHKAAGKWAARVRHNKKDLWGGLFDNIDDAAAKATELRNSLFTNNQEDRW